ncbi:TPA: helix-turn-helix transcriptional regulator [Clostridioides difficile]|uniref:helix-turn-helix transcriptional regulator n=1 Tax=Clostridioides TaxID=1870884 RepID=UPI00038CDC9F|nr:helix-turn-helix transcriptional regulator [Clostridioides difficile]EII6834307.1 helix-turn-helix transcriptional regulator [Clostridioides difficile]EIJ0739590.1 helix-turn-helix transcriptional regulator [Clostridioides difficile]EKS7087284.1 helix-turn-helix transcriptional regulator [Clostridioides difficile]EQI01072.1 helix-turn-helix family protein [Clostridioides difficile F314]MBH7063766.1 helix-turn-helix transcriptional regulator [Clostridioides difficile]
MAKITNNLYKARKELNFSQSKLAQKVGISRPYLSKIENGMVKPSAEITYRISIELGKSIEEIFFTDSVNYDLQDRGK